MSDALVERLAGVLIAHESFGGGWFCRCTPEDENGSREPLPVSWEQHLVEKQAEVVEQEIAAARAAAWDEGFVQGELLGYNAVGDVLFAESKRVIPRHDYRAARALRVEKWKIRNPYADAARIARTAAQTPATSPEEER